MDRAAAEDWIRAYVEPVGAIETEHERPWATVLRVPLADGVAWFKACARVQVFEPRLPAELFDRWPDRVATVLAHDERRAWLLLADAGTPIGAFGNPPEAWLAALPLYAELQRSEAARTHEHLAHGVHATARRVPRAVGSRPCRGVRARDPRRQLRADLRLGAAARPPPAGGTARVRQVVRGGAAARDRPDARLGAVSRPSRAAPAPRQRRGHEREQRARRQPYDRWDAAHAARQQDERPGGHADRCQRAQAREPGRDRGDVDLPVRGHRQPPLGQAAGHEETGAPQRRRGGRCAVVQGDAGGAGQRHHREPEEPRAATRDQRDAARAEYRDGRSLRRQPRAQPDGQRERACPSPRG